ncbi:MAG: oligopeptide transport system permease protein [Verrucomicrobiales bacterium]|jgi:oligopeptide transport system permease protein
MSANSNAQVEQGTSLGQDAWLRLRKNKLAMISLWTFVAIVLVCFFVPLLGIKDPNQTDLAARSTPPGAEFWFGSENLGRDIFSRVLHGGRISLAVGFLATFVSMTIGMVYGAVSGYIGGRTDAVMMRIVDILYALPFMIIVIILTTLFGNKLWLLFVAIGAVEWLTMARIVRAQIMALKEQEFVEAAVSLGLSNSRIIFRHLIPNVLGPVIVYTTLTVPAVMRLEAVLSFLGLGVQPPQSSWGVLIKEGADRMQSDPALLLFPALFFSATLFCLNFLGDGLRDALDVKTSKD